MIYIASLLSSTWRLPVDDDEKLDLRGMALIFLRLLILELWYWLTPFVKGNIESGGGDDGRMCLL